MAALFRGKMCAKNTRKATEGQSQRMYSYLHIQEFSGINLPNYRGFAGDVDERICRKSTPQL